MSLLSLSQLDLDIYYVFQHEMRIDSQLLTFFIYCHLLISTPVDITGLVRPR